jgi:hypothetical protein
MTWDYVDGSGLWQRYKNSQTGEESIKEHKPRVVKQWCGQHEYSGDIPRNRIIECIHCGQETTFIVGLHEFIDGKLILRKRPKQ